MNDKAALFWSMLLFAGSIAGSVAIGWYIWPMLQSPVNLLASFAIGMHLLALSARLNPW